MTVIIYFLVNVKLLNNLSITSRVLSLLIFEFNIKETTLFIKIFGLLYLLSIIIIIRKKYYYNYNIIFIL